MLIQREGWVAPCLSLHLSHPIVFRGTQSRHLCDSTWNSCLNIFSYSNTLKMCTEGKRRVLRLPADQREFPTGAALFTPTGRCCALTTSRGHGVGFDHEDNSKLVIGLFHFCFFKLGIGVSHISVVHMVSLLEFAYYNVDAAN